MNASTSECSSGCESGWTMYLDDYDHQSSYSADQFKKNGGRDVSEDCGYKSANVEDFDEDEDLSMVSDASSGPPHVRGDEDDETEYFCCGSSASEQANKRKKKKKFKEQRGKHQHLFLDDTASSGVKDHIALPPSGASMEHALGFSQGFSATHFKGKSATQKHFGLFQSSVSGKPTSGAKGESNILSTFLLECNIMDQYSLMLPRPKIGFSLSFFSVERWFAGKKLRMRRK
ncbi:unnamed protein product [Camellia sinensis]